MVEAAFFIPLVIVAVTQMIKMAIPGIKSWVTVLLALVVGILIAVVDGAIGVTNITIAQGVVFSLEAIGITAVAAKAGGGARGDNTSQ
jgi:hypothetical protein